MKSPSQSKTAPEKETTTPSKATAAEKAAVATTTAITDATGTSTHSNSKSMNKSTSFIWQDVNAYHQRLQTFHPNVNNMHNSSSGICLPLQISPIICARFGWSRIIPDNTNDNSDMILLTCNSDNNNNDDQSKAMICIKYHPLLSIQSKEKLTHMYREMLATSHDDGSLFQYDALSWLQDENDTKHDTKHDKPIVPPYLIHLSKEYQMLEDCNTKSGARTSSFMTQFITTQSIQLGKMMIRMSQNNNVNDEIDDNVNTNDNINSNDNDNISSLVSIQVLNQMMSVLKTSFPSLSLSQFNPEKEGKDVHLDTNNKNDNEYSEKGLRIIMNNILDKIILHLKHEQEEQERNKKMLLLDDDTTTSIHTGMSTSTKTSHEIMKKIKLLSDDNDNDSTNDTNDNNIDNEVEDTEMKSIAFSSTSGSTDIPITKEALLLSIFGWRLVQGTDMSTITRTGGSGSSDALKSQPLQSTSTQASTPTPTSQSKNRKDEEIQQNLIYVKCNLCLNCSPLPIQYFQASAASTTVAAAAAAVKIITNNSNANYGISINPPPEKKRRICTSVSSAINATTAILNKDEDECVISPEQDKVEVNLDIDAHVDVVIPPKVGDTMNTHTHTNTSNQHPRHTFDLINSHRYYCPFAAGFHQKKTNHIDEKMGMSNHDDDPKPCWETVWESLLRKSLSSISTGNKIESSGTINISSNQQQQQHQLHNRHQSTEERFYALRNKIRGSIIHVN